MSKAQGIKCDRCQVMEFTKAERVVGWSKIVVSTYNVDHQGYDTQRQPKEKDLCKNCAEQLNNFLNGRDVKDKDWRKPEDWKEDYQLEEINR